MGNTTLTITSDNFERFDFLRWRDNKTTDETLKLLLDKTGVPNVTQCRAVRERIDKLKKGTEKDAALAEGPVPAEA